MTQQPTRSILDFRLVIITGKGGTGKTTTTAALALAAAQAGKRVIVAELGHGEHVPRLFAANAPEVGYAGRELRPNLRAMRIDPYEALAEYLGLQLGVRAPIHMVLKNKAFRQFLEATPGWRELITLGKIWHLEQLTDPAGQLIYDMIVVDAPATGHGLTFLDVPHVVSSAVRGGPLRRNAMAVEALVRDASRTLLLPVSLAEELPARETAELAERVREDVGIAVDRVVINGIAPAPFPAGLEDLDQRLARLDAAPPALDVLPPWPVLSACASLLASRHQLNRSYVEQIARDTHLPIVSLPYLDGGLRGPGDLEVLARALTIAPSEAYPFESTSALEAARANGEAA